MMVNDWRYKQGVIFHIHKFYGKKLANVQNTKKSPYLGECISVLQMMRAHVIIVLYLIKSLDLEMKSKIEFYIVGAFYICHHIKGISSKLH